MSTNLKRPLRVLFTNYFPYSNNLCPKLKFPLLQPNKDCPLPGIVSEIVGILAKELNLEVIPTIIRNGDGNRGTIIEALGGVFFPYNDLLLNGTIDMMGITFQKTPERLLEYDFSEPLYEVYAHLFIYREDQFGANWWSVFGVYDKMAWQMIIGLLLLQCLFCLLVRQMEMKCSIRESIDGTEIIWKIIRLQCFQYKHINFTFKAGTLSVFIFSLLQCTLLFGLFGSYLFSSMAKPLLDPHFKKVETLLNDIRQGKREIVGLGRNSWLQSLILSENRFPYKDLREALGNRSFVYASNYAAATGHLHYKNGIIFGQSDDKLSARFARYCDIVPSEFEFRPMTAHLRFRKNFTMLKEIDRVIRENKPRIDNIVERSIVKGRDHNSICGDFKLGDAMRLPSYFGLLILCGSFFSLAFLFLATEIILGLIKNKRSNFKTLNVPIIT